MTLPGPRIVADVDRCVGAGQCVLAAPDLFDQDDDGLVVVLGTGPLGPDGSVAAREAVDRCPSGALTMVDA